MTNDQWLTLAVLVGTVAALIHGRVRADVVALAGAAVLLVLGVVRPREVQAAFASPALLALASLFVIVYAIELSGLLDALIGLAVRLCRRIGAAGLWITIAACGGASAFLNNTPIVVLAAPVLRDAAETLSLDPRRFLMPLSYMAILGGCCTLIGTSTNLLVSDMARVAGQPPFGIFEITPVGLCVAAAGGLYLMIAAPRLIRPGPPRPRAEDAPLPSRADADVGAAAVFAPRRPFQPGRAALAITVFAAVVAAAALGLAPLAAAALAGAVALILLRAITADEAYGGLRPDILLLIAGMVVVGIALESSGLAGIASDWLVGFVGPFGPFVALAIFYLAVLFMTELLSNATVAVLFTPVAVALAESLGVSPRPFLVALMMAASAAFATPFGYQTNTLVYRMGGYAYMDFVRVGLPLNLLTWVVGLLAISLFFPF